MTAHRSAAPAVTAAPVGAGLGGRAGPLCVAAGALLAAADLGRLATVDRSHLAADLLDPAARAFGVAYLAAFPLLLVAVVALWARGALGPGRAGVVALGTAAVGILDMAGNMWFEGFAVPWLAEVAPDALTAAPTPILEAGGLSSYVLSALGWLLVGLAALRARACPPLVALAVVAAGVVAFRAGMPPYGVPIGLALAALGGTLRP